MEEYKIITGLASDCQKWLNQWKHQYALDIHQMCILPDGQTQILLSRWPKANQTNDQRVLSDNHMGAQIIMRQID